MNRVENLKKYLIDRW